MSLYFLAQWPEKRIGIAHIDLLNFTLHSFHDFCPAVIL